MTSEIEEISNTFSRTIELNIAGWTCLCKLFIVYMYRWSQLLFVTTKMNSKSSPSPIQKALDLAKRRPFDRSMRPETERWSVSNLCFTLDIYLRAPNACKCANRNGLHQGGRNICVSYSSYFNSIVISLEFVGRSGDRSMLFYIQYNVY